jgi:hypothetical protein
VRGYKEKGNINTPLELAMNNQIDRFNLVIDVIDRVPSLGSACRPRQGTDETLATLRRLALLPRRLDLYVDISRMGFDAAFVASLTPKFEKAFQDMAALEAGRSPIPMRSGWSATTGCAIPTWLQTIWAKK